MLQSSLSRELLEMWAPDPRNGLIITGYSVEGTMARVSTVFFNFDFVFAVASHRCTFLHECKKICFPGPVLEPCVTDFTLVQAMFW